MNRRNFLLQEMGITQWQLRRPDVLKGAVNIVVAENVRLIVVADENLNQQDGFLKDVLRSANIAESDCLWLNFEQISHLSPQRDLNYWLLSKNQEKIDRTLPLCLRPISLWQTPELATLKQNPQAKKKLWQQIQQALSD